MPFKGSIATAELDQMPLEVLARLFKNFYSDICYILPFLKELQLQAIISSILLY